MGSFSNLQGLGQTVTNATASAQPKFGDPSQTASAAGSQDLSSAYPNTINQWDNSQQQIPKANPIGKGSTTASSKLPSPLTNNQSMTGKGA